MKTFISFILKETKHILRDSRTVMILFGMPVVMMLLFGFAISTDVKGRARGRGHLVARLYDAAHHRPSQCIGLFL
jgi:hypothetical protein